MCWLGALGPARHRYVLIGAGGKTHLKSSFDFEGVLAVVFWLCSYLQHTDARGLGTNAMPPTCNTQTHVG